MVKTYRHLYGPVPSRRLGRSLGIDLVPHKICSYDCIYCQIGETTGRTLVRKEYVPEREILAEVKDFLAERDDPIDHLSLSGSGEPTLHSKIGSVIRNLKEITTIPLAVITNGSMLYESEVREDLLQADLVLPSLDAVSKEVFLKVNRPSDGLLVERVIDGLVAFRKIFRGQIWLEILFCKDVNDSKEELLNMRAVVDRIQPDRIHLNTVVRPPSEKWVRPLDETEMEKIREFFGEKAEIISEFDRHPSFSVERDIKEEILKILKRRPLSLSDLSKGMGVPQDQLDLYIAPLIQEGKIQPRNFGPSVYYEIGEPMKKSPS